MKQLTRLLVLFFVLSLLIGCSNSSDPKGTLPSGSLETTLYTGSVDPTTPTGNDSTISSTIPTSIPPAESTVPTAAATVPTETVPVETTIPVETAPTETTVPTETSPTETVPTETTTPVETAPVETTAPTVPPATQSPAASAGFDAVYTDICHLLDSGSGEFEYTYVSYGIWEVVMYLHTIEERYNGITYALEDMDNDGSLEMIVLDAMGNTRILAIYAIQNGQLVMTHEGWARSRLYRLSDGTLYCEGSNGAAYSIFEAYGHRWFTYPKGEEEIEAGYYYAADGSYDPNSAQEITAEEYYAKQAELTQMITTFSVYNFS